LVAGGLSYKEAGARLFLSERTIKYHMAEIMNRLHLENRSQVLAFAGRMGLTAYKLKFSFLRYCPFFVPGDIVNQPVFY
jgi:hypothetical protein